MDLDLRTLGTAQTLINKGEWVERHTNCLHLAEAQCDHIFEDLLDEDLVDKLGPEITEKIFDVFEVVRQLSKELRTLPVPELNTFYGPVKITNWYLPTNLVGSPDTTEIIPALSNEKIKEVLNSKKEVA